ncbi:hypothetical protein [Microbacterium sp. 179-I 3D4 NHS]|uniref:hypothetical protein n=1 Tax=Microbacterium sp. 179-I 3D4 NHS TaxID=3142381 RepID=UPI0039A2016D
MILMVGIVRMLSTPSPEGDSMTASVFVLVASAVIVATAALCLGITTRIARHRRMRGATFTLIAYPLVLAVFGLRSAEHPLFGPLWLQFLVLIALPFAVGYGAHAITTRHRTGDTAKESVR